MKFVNFVFVLNILQAFSFQQNDYKMIHERMVLDWYNTSYVKDPKLMIFHYKRYEKRLNFTGYLLKDLGMDVTNTGQVYKFQSNEYRQFPVLYEANVCSQWTNNTFDLSPVHYDTNLTSCPLKKGFYYGSNIYADESKFPPFAPRGRYMIEVTVYHRTTNRIGRVQWYLKIEATNPLERVHLK